MREWEGDIWECYRDYFIVVPCNMWGSMTNGIARQASQMFEGLASEYKAWCQSNWDTVRSTHVPTGIFQWDRIVIVPTRLKRDDRINLKHVEWSLWALQGFMPEENIAVPEIGCGGSGFHPKAFENLATAYLQDHRFLLVKKNDLVEARYYESH